MKINSINTISFKGINISKRQENFNSASEGEYISFFDSKEFFARWKSDVDFLVKEYDKYKTENIGQLHEQLLQEEQSAKGHSLSGVAKRFLKRKDAFLAQDELLSKQLVYAIRMKEVREQALAEIRKRDELKAKTTSSVFPKTFEHQGVEKIAGYTEEIDILEDEFIFKVKREKAGENTEVFGSLLFFGPNGNGKTHITKALAEATESNIAKVVIPNSSENQAIKSMKKIVSIAEKSAENFKKDRTRTIIFIDEIDKMLTPNSPVLDEFADFVKTCSEKYHCSIFGATNSPLDIALNYDDPDIFPVKMSIDIPNEKNAKEMFNYYLKDRTEGDIDIDKILTVMHQQEAEKGGRYSNGQIRQMLIDANISLQKEKISQQDIEDTILSTYPDISQERADKFQRDYDKLIGKKW